LVEMRVIFEPANADQLTLRFPGMECFPPVIIIGRVCGFGDGSLDVSDREALYGHGTANRALLRPEEISFTTFDNSSLLSSVIR